MRSRRHSLPSLSHLNRWGLILSCLFFCATAVHGDNPKCAHAAGTVGAAGNRPTESRAGAAKSPDIGPLDTPEIARLQEIAMETGDPRPVVDAIQQIIREQKVSKKVIDEYLANAVIAILAAQVLAIPFEEAGAVDSAGLKGIAYAVRVVRATRETLQSAYPQKSPSITIKDAVKNAVNYGEFHELDLHISQLKAGSLSEKQKTVWTEIAADLLSLKSKTIHKYAADKNQLANPSYSAADLCLKLDEVVRQISLKAQ